MIHTRLEGPAKRRIAIIAIPKPQRTRLGRMGVIRNAPTPPVAWTTISDATPDSADGWLSSVIGAQQTASQSTPGTLTYTPAATTPPPPVAPWNSWGVSNCGQTDPQGSSAPSSPIAIAPAANGSAAAGGGPSAAPVPGSNFWAIVGLLGAAAAIVYLAEKR